MWNKNLDSRYFNKKVNINLILNIRYKNTPKLPNLSQWAAIWGLKASLSPELSVNKNWKNRLNKIPTIQQKHNEMMLYPVLNLLMKKT